MHTLGLLTLAACALALPGALPAAPTLLIGNKGEDSLSFVDLASGREMARRETGKMPHEIAISPDGRRAAVVSYGGNGIDIYDVAARAHIKRVDLGALASPHGIAWLADGRILATAEKSDALAIVAADLATVSSIATGQKGSHMVAALPSGGRAYVANMGSGTVSVIDLAGGRKVRDLPAGKEPEGIALSPDGRRLWVADRGGDRVRVFDTGDFRELASIATGKVPIRVALSPDGRLAVTSNNGGGDLTLIDAASLKVVRTIPVSGQAGFQQVTILFSADGSRLYVAETGIDRIAEIAFPSGEMLGRLPASKNGDGLAIAP